MSVVTDVAATPSLLVEHRPWWRSRVTLTAGIVGLMLVAYFGWKAEYPWPASLTWNTLPTHLNDFQTWLVDQRNAESPSLVAISPSCATPPFARYDSCGRSHTR